MFDQEYQCQKFNIYNIIYNKLFNSVYKVYNYSNLLNSNKLSKYEF